MVGTLGQISAFSTMFGKQHSTGAQGGVVFTKDTMLFARVRQIADRGKPAGALGNPANVVASLNFNQDEISMAIGRVQLKKLPGAIRSRRVFAKLVEEGIRGANGIWLLGDPPECESSYWFLMIGFDPAKLRCDSLEFSIALGREGIDGAMAGYPFYPTDQPWYRDAVVYGASSLPWSLLQQKPQHYPLPNAHEANRTIVRIEIHESLGAGEARDLAVALKKIAAYYKA
jgi:dTDP-4-amino-4,6-dideoxygalactose transaminase